MAVSREKLYAEVWAEPMTAVSARYGVSSSFMALVCARMNVPRPPRGYWALVRSGSKLRRPTLPKAGPCDELEWVRPGERGTIAHQLPEAPQVPARRVRKNRDRPQWHPLVVQTREHFAAAKESIEGYLAPSKRLTTDLYVSRETYEGALQLMNALFLALEDRGYLVTFPPKHKSYSRPALDARLNGGGKRKSDDSFATNFPTLVFIGTVAIGLTIFEASELREVKYVNGKYVRLEDAWGISRRRRNARPIFDWTEKREMPSGLLCIRASSPYHLVSREERWCENSPGKLASKVRTIVKALEAEAIVLARLVAEAQQREAVKRKAEAEAFERWRLEEERRRRSQRIKESRDELWAIVTEWAKAREAHAFFDLLEERIQSLNESDRDRALCRLQQARELIGDDDPFAAIERWKTPDERPERRW